MLLVLLLLKLLGQFQVAQTRRALGRGLLLLQGQGDQVVLEKGARTRAVREAGVRLPNQLSLSLSSQCPFSREKHTAAYFICDAREHTPSAEMVHRDQRGARVS